MVTDDDPQNFRDTLVAIGADERFVEWCGERDLASVWAECDRGDWMLWLAARFRVDRRVLVLTVCDCVREVTPVGFLSGRGREAIETVETIEAWCRGEVHIRAVWAAGSSALNRACSNYDSDVSSLEDSEADMAASRACRTCGHRGEGSRKYAAKFAAAVEQAAEVPSVDGGEMSRCGFLKKSASMIRARVPYRILFDGLAARRRRKVLRPRTRRATN